MKLPRWDRNGYVFAVACVAAATTVFMLGQTHFAKGQWALLYLLLIVFVAGVCGFRASLVASVLSFLAWNFFFLPPYYTLTINDPKDWLALGVFLIVGIMMGLQTSRMHDRAREAVAREQEAALLNRLSASLVSISSTRTMTDAVLHELQAITGAHSAAVFLANGDGQLSSINLVDTLLDDTTHRQAAWVFQQNKAIGLPNIRSLTRLGVEGWPISVSEETAASQQDIYLPIQSPSRIEGVLFAGARTDGQPYSPHEARLLVSIANLVASFLERQRLESATAHVEALHEAERLKGTLISSVSHQLKTPLAAVTATVTSLLEGDLRWDPATVRGELSAVSDDLSRLNDSIGALLDLSRLKADAWTPQRDWYELGEILGAALQKLPEAQRRRIAFAIPDDLPLIEVDFQQVMQALLHLLENALAYSPEDTVVTVGGTHLPHETRVWVEDRGPGIAPADHGKIFEQFYRGSGSQSVPSGTGLGLAITAEIVRFHGGRIWAESAQPHGARFVMALPREKSASGEVLP